MMELDLSLGEPQKPLKFFANSSKEMVHKDPPGLGFCMGLSPSSIDEELIITCKRDDNYDQQRKGSSQDPPLLQLHLHPFSPLHKQYPFPLNPHCLTSERRNRSGLTQKLAEEDAATGSSSPNSSMMSSFGMEYFGIYKDGSGKREHDHQEIEIKKEFYSCSRGESDEEDNGVMGRKKLRLTKDQSAFLEESFKDHHTLNPKQKLALAKHLNLRPRQVEVWFQNRRARTKLKQTEVDCDYLKRCCETLTEENRRLQKELQELRTLKSSNPFYMQLPATTLTMCPSCEHVSSTTTSTAAAITTGSPAPATKPRLLPFLQDQCHAQLQANSN